MRQNPKARFGWQHACAIVALGAVVGFAGRDAFTRSSHLLELSAGYGVAVDAPKIDARSPTGYADGRRSLMLPPGAADSAHWVMHTQKMLAGEDWRVRRAEYDNAPDGRDVHWSLPFRCWMGAVAWIDHAASGRPIGIAAERAALWAGPLMFGLLLLIVTSWLARGFSCAAAAIFALGAGAMYPFYLDFRPGAPDHHGLANICGLLAVLALAAGSLTSGTAPEKTGETLRAPQNRRWLVASGVAGGIGLWISAATLVPVLIGVGLGILGAAWLARRERVQIPWLREPELLRLWSWTGASVSFGAYLIEYFPSHMGWRLEVNHPLYALAWIGAGEILRVAALAARDGRHSLLRRDVAVAVVGMACVGLLPFCIWMTGERTFTVRDRFVWQLHSLYISEFQGLARHFAGGVTWNRIGIALPGLLLAVPFIFIFRPSLPRADKARLLLTALPALLGWSLGCMQVRWLGLAFALSVPMLAVFFSALRGLAPRAQLFWSVGVALVFLPGAVDAVQRMRANGEITADEIRTLAERDVAHWLRLRAGAQPVVLACGPTPTTTLIYFGGVKGLGTLYWENSLGLKKAAELFAATPEAAAPLARRLGVTHVVVFSWSRFEVALAKLHRGLPENAPIPTDSLVGSLSSSPVAPNWLRPLPFKLPEHPALANARVQIWEVRAPQPPAAALVAAANYYLEIGDGDSAGRLLPSLARFENDLPAAVMRAGILARQQDGGGFTAALGRVLALSGNASALTLDDQIHLSVVLTVGQRLDAARTQLQSAMAKVDEASLRRLTPGTLADLVALSRAFQIDLPSRELAQLAQQLLPPEKRA